MNLSVFISITILNRVRPYNKIKTNLDAQNLLSHTSSTHHFSNRDPLLVSLPSHHTLNGLCDTISIPTMLPVHIFDLNCLSVLHSPLCTSISLVLDSQVQCNDSSYWYNWYCHEDDPTTISWTIYCIILETPYYSFLNSFILYQNCHVMQIKFWLYNHATHLPSCQV
jgi:hypothetical protein